MIDHMLSVLFLRQFACSLSETKLTEMKNRIGR